MADTPRPPAPVQWPWADGPLPAETRLQAGAALAAGELLALPTETVYGLAARADQSMPLERLRDALGRGSGALLTWHLGLEQALALFDPTATTGGVATAQRPPLAPLLARLARRYWPGPLTLVAAGLPQHPGTLADAGWVAVRVPAQQATRALLESLPFPVAVASATGPGEPAANTAADVAQRFGGRIAALGDGGPARIGQPSAVLAVGRGRFELMRPGLLELSDLRHTAGQRLAFVCTGNTCRSPMAEGLARKLLMERLGALGPEPVRGDPARAKDAQGRLAAFGFELQSMGVAAGFGAPASTHAVSVLRSKGIDLSSHQSQPATPERLMGTDLALCLTRSHARALESLLPPGRGPTIELLDPSGRDVPDPIGGDLEAYRQCAGAIEAALRARLNSWA